MGKSIPAVAVGQPISPGPRYLFLQGPNGPFFCQLARRLLSGGATVYRIHFNGGDAAFWSLRGALAIDYRQGVEQWPEFVGQRLGDWQISDLVLFGDCRPLHRVAIGLARLRGVRVHVFEEGYLRPNWVTLEAHGVNRNSLLPKDPDWYRHVADGLAPPPPVQAVPGNFARRAAEDVLYTLNLVVRAWLYPDYRTHRPWHPLVEYRAGARRFLFRAKIRRNAAIAVGQFLADPRPYFLFPLQLHSDAQIRFHSPYGSMGKAIESVIESFARHAPEHQRLVLTEHPLDCGVIDLKRIALTAAQAHGVADRLLFVEGGSPDALLRRAGAVVTVNSTIGIVALGMNLPVAVLGAAIYAIPGLVHGGTLDDFWSRPQPPDAALFSAFHRVVLEQTQIGGSFYSVEGRHMAADGAARRMQRAALSSALVSGFDFAAPPEAPAAETTSIELG
ncbi:MAG: capsular biosynthesis protein [Hydrocarboniphaga sp.]|uniref:capsule biosynthesis protein n=1 Tax=Hydrocarboniphaga sp. TaxID=2033016 RepID=UPI002601B19E|nr:capsular biosynthesis protein [Hydrocarboniphaga sp.]MDB5972045.1 capsular biosynthesis protein [Hydrocarboniphaga sp.]